MKKCTMCERPMSRINPNLDCWPCMRKANKKMLPVVGPNIVGRLIECATIVRDRRSGVDLMDHQYYGQLR